MFSSCPDSDSYGCSDYDGEYNSAECVSTENGCLFNLAVDPCEVTDVGDEFPELRAKLIERLEGYVASTPDALLTTTSTLKYSDYGPAGDFWGPFWEYEQVDFEDDLAIDFQRLYGAGEQVLGIQRAKVGRIEHHDPLRFNTILVASVMAMMAMILILYRGCWSGSKSKTLSTEHAPLLRT